MVKNYEEATGIFRNATRRYLAKVIGQYIESDIEIGTDWRKDSVWKGIVKNEFNNECIYCGSIEGEEIEIVRKKNKQKVVVKLEREHLVSISEGGLDIKANIAPACRTCNSIKGDKLDWKDYFKKIKEEESDPDELEQIKQREERVIQYIDEKCKWKEVQEHKLYNAFISDITSKILETNVLQWVTNWLNDDLYEYIYHITTKKAVDAVYRTAEKLYPVEDNTKIKCSYELLLDMVISDSFTFEPNEELVLLAMKKERLKELGISYDDVYTGALQPFLHIKEKVHISEFAKSKYFILEDVMEPLLEAVIEFPFSLINSERKFSGYNLGDK
jgi:hypothetical protein